MHAFLLKILDLFKWLFVALHVDYNQLRAILSVKLTMDNRRQLISYQTKNKKEPNNTFLISLLVYAFLGMFVSITISNIPSMVMGMMLFFSYLIVMIIMTLITDFSSILLDTSDNTIILPRPVDGRTLFAARTTHILLYLSQMVIGLTLFPMLTVGMKYGVSVLPFFLLNIVLATATAIVLTNAFYLLLMQFANEEKLKNIINSFQIVMAIFVMGGYQLLPRVMERLDLENYVFNIAWWNFLLPPAWFAVAMETVYQQVFDIGHLALSSCALIIPVGSGWLVNRYLTPVFNRKLSGLNHADAITPPSHSEKKSIQLTDKLASVITSNKLERGAFEFIYKILGRDRKLKLKVYPAYGYVLIFGIIFMFKGSEDIITTWAALPNTSYYIVLIYLTFMIIQMAIFEIKYSDEFKASWIYFAAPIAHPGDLLVGTLKAVFVRLFIPGYLIMSIVTLTVWGIDKFDDLVFGLINNFIMLITLALINQRSLPLSTAPSLRGQSGNVARNIFSFVIIGALGLGHYLLIMISPWLILAVLPVMAAIAWYLLRTYRGTTWEKLVL